MAVGPALTTEPAGPWKTDPGRETIISEGESIAPTT
jgi:hypothetical protein